MSRSETQKAGEAEVTDSEMSRSETQKAGEAEVTDSEGYLTSVGELSEVTGTVRSSSDAVFGSVGEESVHLESSTPTCTDHSPRSVAWISAGLWTKR